MDKVSYALGMSLGNNLLQSGITTLDYARLAQGTNARRPEVVTLPSGLQYEVVREGTGPMTNPPKPEWSSSPPLLGIFLFTPTKSTFKLSATNQLYR